MVSFARPSVSAMPRTDSWDTVSAPRRTAVAATHSSTAQAIGPTARRTVTAWGPSQSSGGGSGDVVRAMPAAGHVANEIQLGDAHHPLPGHEHRQTLTTVRR